MPIHLFSVERRKCESCHVCCVETEITDVNLKKSCNVTCPNLDLTLNTNKCKIYNNAPSQCKDYYCSWMMGYGNELDRPDYSGIIANRSWDGKWTFIREVASDALTTTGKNLVIDIVARTNFPAIVKFYNSSNEAGDCVIVKKELLPRASRLAGNLIKWIDQKKNIGLYELKIQGK